ncbi:MAG TPA: hypothetical protein QGF58_03650 [Myxococcota bacterium]|nr:hypothetical protein [Myxococcota bacterium]
MELALIRFLAQTFGVAFTASPRPGLTFFVVQVTVAFVSRMGWVTMEPALAWLISLPCVMIAFVMAGLEILARHDEEIEELLRDFNLTHVLGVFGTFTGCLVFAALGLPEEEALGLVEEGASHDVGTAMALASASEQSDVVRYGAIGGGVAMNLGITSVRGRIIEFFSCFDLDKQWHRIETGGVVGVLTLLIWLPVLALVLVVLLTLALGVIAVAVKVAEKWADERGRRECPSCETKVRKEASLCFQCRSALEPEVVLGSTVESQWQRMMATLRRQPG